MVSDKTSIYLICRSGTGKVFDVLECGQKGGRGGEVEETCAEAEAKKPPHENSIRISEPCQHGRKSPTLAKGSSREAVRVLFPRAGSVQPYLEEMSVDACPVYQVCQSWQA